MNPVPPDRCWPLTAARWLVLPTIALAPWPYACIPRWTHPAFTGSLLVIAILWTVGWILRRRWPAVPAVLLTCIGLLLVQGWLLIGNAQYSYDRLLLTFVPAHPWWSGGWVPGALDTEDALPTMMRISGLLAMLCVVTDMARHAIWRERLLGTMLVSGMALILYGLAQRMLNLPLFLWEGADLNHNLFGSFYYHGNAGAFVNLIIPLLVGYVALAFRRQQSHRDQVIAATSLLLSLAAAVAIASKAAMAITALLIITAGYATVRTLFGGRIPRPAIGWLPTIGLAILTLLAVVLFGFERAAQRWSRWSEALHAESPRLIAWQACVRILKDAGPWGVGPGNFQITFPHYTQGLKGIDGVWEHAHQDYLETWIDWGWWGLAVWSILVAGAVWRAIRRSPATFRPPTRERVERMAAGFSLGGVLLHACVDFPLQIPAIQLYTTILLGILWSRQPGNVLTPARVEKQKPIL